MEKIIIRKNRQIRVLQDAVMLEGIAIVILAALLAIF